MTDYRYLSGEAAAIRSVYFAMPGLSRAPTSLKQRGNVVGRNKSGHDDAHDERRGPK
jgi:hypothetical protein